MDRINIPAIVTSPIMITHSVSSDRSDIQNLIASATLVWHKFVQILIHAAPVIMPEYPAPYYFYFIHCVAFKVLRAMRSFSFS